MELRHLSRNVTGVIRFEVDRSEIRAASCFRWVLLRDGANAR
jgi:hypothetical protein